MQEDTHTTNESDSFATVAVGASAGGLEAFTSWYAPSRTTLAWHSYSFSIWTPSTAAYCLTCLPRQPDAGVEAKHGTTIEPNHVYVIPPNVNMGILVHRLQLDAAGESLSCTHRLISSCARWRKRKKNRSIGVVLSDTASDGTRGVGGNQGKSRHCVRSRGAHGGLPGMPHSAIASGCVDFVLPPKRSAKSSLE